MFSWAATNPIGTNDYDYTNHIMTHNLEIFYLNRHFQVGLELGCGSEGYPAVPRGPAPGLPWRGTPSSLISTFGELVTVPQLKIS